MSGIKNVGYVIHVTEFESGWGSRPDGILISFDLKELQAKCEQINKFQGSEFSRAAFHSKTLRILTQKAVDALKESPVLWTDNNLSSFLEAN